MIRRLHLQTNEQDVSPMSSPTFGALGVPAHLVARLATDGIHEPSPIQSAVIADVLAGRDVAGRAPTGSGKTLAFGVPLVANLRAGAARRPTALVLAPTRELAQQIAAAVRPLAALDGHRVASVYGGVGYGPQKHDLNAGAALVIACPGRLEDLLSMGAIELSDVRTVVLDEADRMADMGFLPAVRRIIARCHGDRQTLLFSATFDGAIGKLAKEIQRQPVRHEVGAVGPDITAATHLFWRLDREQRTEWTARVATELGATMVFCRTRHGADRLARQLARAGVTAAPIHGGRSQPQRDRALREFTAGTVTALVATDVAARGVHVDDVAAVVHYDPPGDSATYIHRSGRTARAGASGVVVSLVTPGTESDVAALRRDVKIDVAVTAPATDAFGAAGSARPAQSTRPAQPAQPTRQPAPARRDERPAAGNRAANPGQRSRRGGRGGQGSGRTEPRHNGSRDQHDTTRADAPPRTRNRRRPGNRPRTHATDNS